MFLYKPISDPSGGFSRRVTIALDATCCRHQERIPLPVSRSDRTYRRRRPVLSFKLSQFLFVSLIQKRSEKNVCVSSVERDALVASCRHNCGE